MAEPRRSAATDAGDLEGVRMLVVEARFYDDIADALLAGDSAELSKALQKYLRHYRKNEFNTRQVELGICADANVLWHFARRRKLKKVELPDDLALFIVQK